MTVNATTIPAGVFQGAKRQLWNPSNYVIFMFINVFAAFWRNKLEDIRQS